MKNRIEPFLVATLIVFIAALSLWLRYPASHLSFQNVIPGDFAVYLRAWERVSNGVDPYVASDASPYKYAPGVLGLIALLPQSSPGAAWFAFGTLSILGLAVSLLIGARYPTWKQVGALILGLGLSWKGILETLDYGQMELLILGIAVLATSMTRRAAAISGFLAGTLPWLKLPWVMLLIPLLLSLRGASRGRYSNFLSGYLASCVFWGAALPALLFGPDRALLLSQSWVELLRSQPSSLFLSDINQSAWVTAWRWIGGTLSLAVTAIVMGAVLGRMILRTGACTRASHTSPLATISPWLILVQLLNPLSWRWGSVFVLGIPFLALGKLDTKARRYSILIASLVALILLSLQLNPVARALGFEHWTELHGFGIITLFWLVLLVPAIL